MLKSPQIIIFVSTYLNKVGKNKFKNIVNVSLSMFGVLYLELKIMYVLLFNNTIKQFIRN